MWKSPIAVVMAYLHEEGLNSKKETIALSTRPGDPSGLHASLS